jgi:hypothetical protein
MRQITIPERLDRRRRRPGELLAADRERPNVQIHMVAVLPGGRPFDFSSSPFSSHGFAASATVTLAFSGVFTPRLGGRFLATRRFQRRASDAAGTGTP